MSVFEEESDWTIALYEKHSRVYQEVGVFLEGAMSPLDAFEAFSEVCSALPPWQAIKHALSVESETEPVPAYEIRLYDVKDRRVVATALWGPHLVKECMDDYKSRKMTSYRLSVEVELDQEHDPSDPEDWDWDELSATGKLRVLDISPSDSVE